LFYVRYAITLLKQYQIKKLSSMNSQLNLFGLQEMNQMVQVNYIPSFEHLGLQNFSVKVW